MVSLLFEERNNFIKDYMSRKRIKYLVLAFLYLLVVLVVFLSFESNYIDMRNYCGVFEDQYRYYLPLPVFISTSVFSVNNTVTFLYSNVLLNVLIPVVLFLLVKFIDKILNKRSQKLK